ncbi:MAG: 50S ribosomal protein L15 [Epsilonproteobacteria bacterium]|nr:50S ribosomal protein L15 [Campylobacterota bacterium]
MFQLNKLEKTTTKRKRVGRGGDKGRYSGRGKEGQRARAGGKSELRPFFEGGQMPLIRRLPCRGFVNQFKTEYEVIGLRDLERKFDAGECVNRQTLKEKGLIKRKKVLPVKVLSTGTLSKQLTVQVDAISESAKAAIEQVGGKVELIKEMSSGGASA